MNPRKMATLWPGESAASQMSGPSDAGGRTRTCEVTLDFPTGLTVRMPPSWLFRSDRHCVLTSVAHDCTHGMGEKQRLLSQPVQSRTLQEN